VPFIAVRFLGKRTANSPVCHAFSGRRTANRGWLPCVFQGGARQTTPVCCAFCSRRTAKVVPRRLALVPLVAFVCRASRKNARQRLSTVRCQTRRTAKVLRRAKCYRAPFAVRPDKKRTAKGLPCILNAFAMRSGRTAKALFPVVKPNRVGSFP
jgi:hypothetical protein